MTPWYGWSWQYVALGLALLIAGLLSPTAMAQRSETQCDAAYCYERICRSGAPSSNCRFVTSRNCRPAVKEDCSTQYVRKCQRVAGKECGYVTKETCQNVPRRTCRDVTKYRYEQKQTCTGGGEFRSCYPETVTVPYVERVCTHRMEKICRPTPRQECRDTVKEECAVVPERTCRNRVQQDCRDERRYVCERGPAQQECETRKVRVECSASQQWTENGCVARARAEREPPRTPPARYDPPGPRPTPQLEVKRPAGPSEPAPRPYQNYQKQLPDGTPRKAPDVVDLVAPLLIPLGVAGGGLLIYSRWPRRFPRVRRDLRRHAIRCVAQADPGTQSISHSVVPLIGSHITIRSRLGPPQQSIRVG